MPGRGDAFVPLNCAKCGLCEGRTQVVPAEGGKRPLAFFVGEAPGPDEDREGRPFVGRAGKILRRALHDAGWKDEDVWITNVVKCFPHERDETDRRRIRKPSRTEMDACREHLVAEVRALNPVLLVALGRTGLDGLTGGLDEKIQALRGRTVPAREELGGVPVMATFHPSGLHYGHATEADLVEDLRRARRFALDELLPEREQPRR